MGTKHISRAKKDEAVKLYSEGGRTLEEIAGLLGVTRKQVWRATRRIPDEQLTEIKRDNYSSSKLGENNPMKGKFGEKHPNYRGECDDGNGYKITLKPDWYTGRGRSKHIFVHHLVICEALGLAQIPSGFSVHHIDGDRTNNLINNLALLTNSAHSRLHGLDKGWKVQRLSRKGVGPKRARSARHEEHSVPQDDIV